jgi:cis-L-3-hydroxyproline dehydratase
MQLAWHFCTMTLVVDGRFLIASSLRSSSSSSVETKESLGDGIAAPLLVSTVPLSFWGGVDPVTGVVIDTSHPLAGECVSGRILCIPSGRGSCTASQVLLELILNHKAPKAIVLRDADGLISVGAIIAQEILQCRDSELDIVCIGEAGFATLVQATTTSAPTIGQVLPNGHLMIQASAGKLPMASDSNWNESKIGHAEATCANYIDYTETEEGLLRGCTTDAERMALRVIFRFARIVIHGAMDTTETAPSSPPHYITVAQAHIDGCTYIGPGGLEFVQRLVKAQGRVKVPTTLNSVSTDRRQWQALGVPPDYARNSIALGDAYLELNCQPSFTCAPYLLPQAPNHGQDIAWGESNAVVYANSVLGARTEKYADYLDICCAIAGIVPQVGVHLAVNRVPQIVLDGTVALAQIRQLALDSSNETDALDLDLLFPTLGHLCGTLSDGRVPILVGLQEWTDLVSADHLKAFCAAFGTTASSPLIHIAGLTPEALNPETIQEFVSACGDQVRTFSLPDLANTFNTLDSNSTTKSSVQSSDCSYTDTDGPITIDLVALGNPHLSVSECSKLATLIRKAKMLDINTADETIVTVAPADGLIHPRGTRQQPKSRIMACMSRSVHAQVKTTDLREMQDFGVEFIFDTCWCMLLNEPVIPARSSATILTNSGKYAHYGPGLTNRKFRLGSMADCIRAAQSGVYSRRLAGDGNVANPSQTFLHRQVRQYGMDSRSIRGAFVILRRF